MECISHGQTTNIDHTIQYKPNNISLWNHWTLTYWNNLLSAIPYIGDTIVLWIWGGFSINNAMDHLTL